MPKAYRYILECSNGAFYKGTTTCLEEGLKQHNEGKGGNDTKKQLPVTLIYYEKHTGIDAACHEEQQGQ
jgi:putative endonuclease